MTKVRKVARRKGKGPASAVNAVVVATAGGSGEQAAVSSRQRVEIVQRGGETVVRESTHDTQGP